MKKIVIVGAGALGSHVALAGRNWDGEMLVIDFDVVETKNTQSQLHPKSMLRRNKATSLQQTLNFMFGIRIQANTNKLTSDNVEQLLGGATLLIDCTDNIAARQLIQAYAKAHAIPCLHGGLTADGTFGRCMWTEDFVPDPEGEEGAATCEDGEHLPFFQMVSARIAWTAQRFLETGEKRGYEVALSGSKRVV